MKDYRWESGICSILVILLFFIHCETTFAVGTIKVHKGYLKYERGTAIKYASTYWHSINWTGGYYNYRGLGGDCANFVSQIFIAGGIRELTKNLDPNIIGIGNVIKGAQELPSRLVNFPLTWIPVMEGANVVSSTSELENGDPSFITGTTSKGGHWYHILVLNNQTAEGVTGHTPYEFYPYPREKWDIQETHIDPNGSVLQSYKKTILALGLAVEYYDFSSPPGYPSTTWLIPTLGNAYPNPPFTTHFIHIPDVPVVTKIELVEINSKDGSTDGFYYRAFLDDTKNSGDGEIERSNADIKPVDLKKDLNLQLRIYFNLQININYKKNDEEHYVKLVQMAPVLIQSPAGWAFIEKASIDLKNPKLKDNSKTLIYEMPIDEIKKLDTNQKWYIKIRAFAESDDTPLNGSGAYAEYKDEPDINHYFYTMPKIDVKRAQVYKLHLPMVFEGEEPPREANLQPIRSDGAIPLDWNKIGYLYSRCITLPAWEKVSCTMDATMQAMKKLLPTYYLGPEILSAAVAAPVAPEPILLDHYDADNHSLEAGLQPVYTALVQTIDDNRNDGLVPRIEPLAMSGALRDEVRLWLDVNPIKPGEERGYNTVSPSKTSLDISNLYDIYLFKDAPDQALIALPLKRLYESSEGKSLPDGAHTLRIETSLKNEEAEDKGYESLLTLKYLKDDKNGKIRA